MLNSCVVCGAKAGRHVASRGAQWCICDKCGSWTLCSPSDEKAYPAEYYGSPSAKFRGAAGGARSFFQSARAKKVCQLKAGADAAIYDIGCGDGAFLDVIRRRSCFAICGFEPEAVPRTQASSRLGCHVDEELFAGAYADFWDVVTAWQVIEHVADPRALVRAVKKKLKPDGLFALSTVNVDSLQARLFGPEWLHLDPPRHLWCSSLKALENLLSEEGFVVESRCWRWLEFGPVGIVDSILNVAGFPRNELVRKLKVGFDGLIDPVFWGAAVFTPPAIAFAAVEAMVGRSATFELYLRKTQ